jgi:tRNA threonylcarbamoyladenosine biosynthesis protein TsaB
MITLGVDTCDGRGSVGVRQDGRCVGVCLHEVDEYSSWLLPAVESSLKEAGVTFQELDLLAVANGPGSFTGVRVGLCAVKAWAEVYGKRVVGVSRLEAMASCVAGEGWVTACYDAHRGQIFAGLYRKSAGVLERMDEEMVVGAEQFVARVKEMSRGERVQWITLDPEILEGLESWRAGALREDELLKCESGLANAIGALAEAKAARGEVTDVMELDANYLRRSDAEIYWKGPSYRGG